MSANLCPLLPATFGKAAVFDEFFEKTEGRNVRKLESREQPIMGVPPLAGQIPPPLVTSNSPTSVSV